jgi:hypothetical protein
MSENGLVRYVPTDWEELAASLRAENLQLKRDLADARRDVERAGAEAARAVRELRKQLLPLYRALQGVFGEMESFTPESNPASSGSAVWDEWKRRLGAGPAKVIDILLLGGEMTVTGIATTGKMAKQTVYDATSKMGKAGILVRNGSKFSLKPL